MRLAHREPHRRETARPGAPGTPRIEGLCFMAKRDIPQFGGAQPQTGCASGTPHGFVDRLPALHYKGRKPGEAFMIVVTGGAGMIGSNIVAALNAEGRPDIVVVDDLTDGHKVRNLADLAIADYLDKDDFLPRLEAGGLGAIEAVFHQGACSTTTEWNGKFMMEVNYAYSRRLLDACLKRGLPFLYASSASVYGGGSDFRE
jgi:hypothetical protein